MDLREYYRKLHEIEAKIAEPFVMVISRKTSDGGRAGRRTQVPRDVAAKLIVDGKADLEESQCC
ncbi:MAG: hypothetical protein WDO18_21070 [Acidobacteriota bacterium]